MSPDTRPKGDNNGTFTVGILGCGTMGKAVLCGFLDNLLAAKNAKEDSCLPRIIPARYILTVGREQTAKKLEEELKSYQSHFKIGILHGDRGNIEAAAADLVLLACKPWKVNEVLGPAARTTSIPKKPRTLLSMVGGCTTDNLSNVTNGLYDKIGRVMPNTPCKLGEGMTVIAEPDHPNWTLDADMDSLVTWIFSSIGKVVHLPGRSMDAATALCGSGPAFAALVLEAMADGGVAMGIPRKEALIMATQAMRGATALVQDGEHPAVLRDKVSTPGGCTIGGLLVMEEGAVRGSVARAVREATMCAQRSGQGHANVNAPR